MPPGAKYVQLRATIPEITFELAEGRAVELVSFDCAARRARCHAEALEALTAWTGSIALVVNLGQPRAGKTALLNRLLDLGEGFPPGGCALRLWTKPLFNAEENLNTYFLDAQGCEEEFARNFCWLLAFLLGSALLFSTGALGPAAWRQLDPLRDVLARLVASEDAAENAYALGFCAPRLLWLLKDARAEERDERGLPLGADALLERELRGAADAAGNKRLFETLFKERGCFCFAPAAAAESLAALKERVYAQTRPKVLEGFALSPRMLVGYVGFLVDYFNADRPIDFGGLLDAVLAQQCEGCLADALAAHAEELERLPAARIDARSSDGLFALLKTARRRALARFQLPDDARERLAGLDAARAQLAAQIRLREEKVLAHFRAAAAENNRRLAAALTAKLLPRAGGDAPAALLRQVAEEYIALAKGDEKAAPLAALLAECHRKIVAQLCAARTAQELKDEDLDVCYKPFLARKAELDARIALLRAQKRAKEETLAAALGRGQGPSEALVQLQGALREAERRLLDDEAILAKQRAELERQAELLAQAAKRKKGLCG